MARKNNNESSVKINPKNYIYAVLVLVGSILLTLYIFSWYRIKKEEKLMNSYLLTTNTIEFRIDNLELYEQIISEAPSSYFLFLGYTNSEEEYNFEKSLKRVIDKYKLNDLFYYIDLTNYINDENHLETVKNKLKLEHLNSLPAIVYVNDGSIISENILDGKSGTIVTIKDFTNLLDFYNFEVIK